MQPTKKHHLFTIFVLILFLTACSRSNTVCPPDEGAQQPAIELATVIEMPPPPQFEPTQVEIRGKLTAVDKLVAYPLCNDNWNGTVYVSCDAQVAEAELDAEANPLFLKGCNLNIEPNTVVYVAAHNDAPYYKGCSCHTGEAPQP